MTVEPTWKALVREQTGDESGQRASYRFNNDLRYRDGEHPAQSQFTPGYVLDLVRADLGGSIGLDPCTTADNPTGADAFYTPEHGGLTCTWAMYPSVFVNPPYGKAREPWVRKCVEAAERGQKVILLIPAATDTRIFRLAASTSTAIVYVTGRVKFGTLRPNRRQHAASHPSALIGWGTTLVACSALGWRSVPWPSRSSLAPPDPCKSYGEKEQLAANKSEGAQRE